MPDASRRRVAVWLVVTAATGLVIAALAAGSLFGEAVHVQVIGSGRPSLGGGGSRSWSSQTCEVVLQDGRRDVMQSLGCQVPSSATARRGGDAALLADELLWARGALILTLTALTCGIGLQRRRRASPRHARA